MTNLEEIQAMRNDVLDIENHLSALEGNVLMEMSGPLAASLARLHTDLSMAMLEFNIMQKMLGGPCR